MSLKKAIRKATKAALEAQESLKEKVTLKTVSGTTYDPDSGEPTDIIADTRVIDAWFTAYEDKRIDGNLVQPGDVRCTIRRADVDALPRLDDIILREDGSEWTVMNVKAEISGTLVIMRIRRP